METIEAVQGIYSEGDVHVEGNHVSMGDMHIHQELPPEKIFFRSKACKSLTAQKLLVNISDLTLQTLTHQRMVILNMDNVPDLLDYQDALIERFVSIRQDIEAYELVRNQNDESVIHLLANAGGRAIYVLNDMDPLHIDFNLKGLNELACKQDFYLLISTKSPLKRWKQSGEQVTEIWIEPDCESMYSHQQIREYFLENLKKSMLFSAVSEVSTATLLSPTYSVQDVLSKLSRPLQLQLFLERFQHFSSLPEDIQIEQLILKIGDSREETISRWFEQLSHEQKLLTIACTLFDGAYLLQYFEAIDGLTRGSMWQKSAPSLATVDIKDVQFLLSFTHLEETPAGERIQISGSDFKMIVFQVLWNSYRRHLMSILPNLIHMIRHSYQRNTINWEIYGTPERRSIMRQAFVDAVSTLGVVNLEAFEHLLLDLAASDHYHLQGLVATSLARWRGIGRDKELFDLIEKWQDEYAAKALVSEKLSRRLSISDVRATATAVERIKQTNAIILSRAAEYDKNNHLHERLVYLYGQLADDLSYEVRIAVAKTLPQFLRKHIEQLSTMILESFLKHEEYSTAISDGLYQSYSRNPDYISQLLYNWLESCTQNTSRENRRIKATYRDNTLITVLDCFRKICTNPTPGKSLNPEPLYGYLLPLLMHEGREVVRTKVILVLSRLIINDRKLAIQYLPQVRQHLRKGERTLLLNELVEEYILERSRLKGGDAIWYFSDQYELSIWFDRAQRPITAFEQDLLKWLNHGSSSIREMATLVFLHIASCVEENEILFIREEKLRQVEASREIESYTSVQKPVLPVPGQVTLGLWLRIRILFMLLFESRETKRTLKSILAFLMNVRGYSLYHVRIMNLKWRTYAPDTLASKLGNWLDRLI